jgi:prepilin-type N-terminal cleavage/methylation domain-containing protein
MTLHPKMTGFTLIELLVVMLITAVLASLAAPALAAFKARVTLANDMHQLQSAVLLARHLAVIEQTVMMVCPASREQRREGGYCSGDYSSGVAVWRQHEEVWELVRIWRWSNRPVMNRRGTRAVSEGVLFHPSGMSSRNITWSMCANGANRSLVLNRIGRPSLRDGWGQC